jgi:iron uptake system EfeUOB component EfeO/EfeM
MKFKRNTQMLKKIYVLLFNNHKGSISNKGYPSHSFSKEGTQTKTTNVNKGLSELLASSKELKTAINQGNETKVKTIGPKLEEEWSSFEDQIKPKYPKDYEEVEKYLDPTIAGTKVKPIDKTTLLPLVNHLIEAVQNLSFKINAS